MTNLQDITAVIGGKLYSGRLRADGKYKLTPLRPEPSRGDSSLAEILDTLWGERDLGKAWDAAQAAIAELVEGCLPEKRSDHKLSNNNFNEAIDLIRNNLKAKGIL